MATKVFPFICVLLCLSLNVSAQNLIRFYKIADKDSVRNKQILESSGNIISKYKISTCWQVGPQVYLMAFKDNNDSLEFVKIDTTDWQISTIQATPQTHLINGARSFKDSQNRLYFLGGTNRNEWDYSKKIFRFNISNQTWESIPPNNGFVPRTFATTWDVGNRVYVFGGVNSFQLKDTLFNDLWAFDKVTTQWQKVTVQSDISPLPRQKASGWKDTLNNKIYLFGGKTVDSLAIHTWEDIWCFDLVTAQWSLIQADPGSIRYRNTIFDNLRKEALPYPTDRTIYPGTRHLPTVWQTSQQKAYLWGGQRYPDDYDPLIWQFDYPSKIWKHLTATYGPSNENLIGIVTWPNQTTIAIFPNGTKLNQLTFYRLLPL